MIKKLVQHGNSAALILDKPIEERSEVDVLRSLEKINTKYSRALKKLRE